jgi:molybdopterin biosynthesis enzyme
MDEHRLSDDGIECTLEKIRELIDLGMDMIICTGGMSVDPDDKTPAAIKATGARIITYGAPVLPGAMFLLSYYESGGKKIPILGLPGCVMYAATTIFDIVLPRLAAGIEVTRKDIRHLGAGGLCQNCQVCHYPNCGFGK